MHSPRSFRLPATALSFCAVVSVAVLFAAQGADPQGDPLVAGFKSTYPASVSDAVELVTGKNGTMRYDMKLMTGANVVGRAVTALARPAPADQATPALATKHSVEMIDEAKPGEVGVIVMEGIARHCRNGEPDGDGRGGARHRRNGARRRHSRSLGCAAHGSHCFCAVEVTAYRGRSLFHRGRRMFPSSAPA